MPPKRGWDCPVTPTSAVKNTSMQDYPRMATIVLIGGLSLGWHTFLLTNGLFIIIASTSIANHQSTGIENYSSNIGLVFMKPF